MTFDATINPEFSWVPFYEELADRLATYREPTKQRELITFLEQLRAGGLPITPLEDKNIVGERFLLEEIDPFTFFGSFNRGIKEDKRLLIVNEMKKFFSLKTPTPQDFAGIPVLHNLSSWFFSYRPQRQPDDVSRLWAVFEESLKQKPLSSPAFASAFDRALEVKYTNVNLTMGLFWVRPKIFVSLDHVMRKEYSIKLPGTGITFEYYHQVLKDLQRKSSADFPEMSHKAWQKAVAQPTSQTLRKALPPTDVEYWMVGAYWDDAEPTDQTERFFNEGVWENGYLDKYVDLVKDMKTGDRIAIKAAITQHYGLPFDNRDKTVSKMAIKARGTIVQNRGDGRTVEVEWEPLIEPKDWYFYTARPTVWHLRKSEDMAEKLIRFAFFDEPQDYNYFIEKWWGTSKLDAKEFSKDSEIELLPPYSVADVIAEGVFFSDDEVNLALERLRTKKAIILRGAPGVGKTFLACKLAYALIEARDDSRISTVQFHPSYSYEDFIRGYRPTGEAGKFELQNGPFVQFCNRAQKDPDRGYVMIVDEINRGHLSQIFGELFSLLEADKRGQRHAITPLYPHKDDVDGKFFVPENVYLIGTMNIADRSIALVDFALRRRFAFITLDPQFSSQRFSGWLRNRKMPSALIDRIVQRMGVLNGKVAADTQLGSAFRIGHSFFCPRGEDFSKLDVPWFNAVVKTEIAPLLEEYWYDAPDKVEKAIKELLV